MIFANSFINLFATNSSDNANQSVQDYLIEELVNIPNTTENILMREEIGLFNLTIPADAIPSIQALVSRKNHVIEKLSATGSFIITSDTTLQPIWNIRLPSMDEELLKLQSAYNCINFPILERSSVASGHASIEKKSEFPLAVRFCNSNYVRESNLLMPISPDVTVPLLRHAPYNIMSEETSISVILPYCGRSISSLACFLDSLVSQTVASKLNIIAIIDDSFDHNIINNKLEQFFPGRIQVVKNSDDLSLYERMNLGAKLAHGKFLLFARENIVLHDPRCLDTLCTISENDNVASAGCILVKENVIKKSQKVVFYSGGVFPSYSGILDLKFNELECYSALPNATYPVACNSSLFFMVRSSILEEIGGFNTAEDKVKYGDIFYGLSAIEKGFYNLCTSVVSAGMLSDNYSTDSLYVDVSIDFPLTSEEKNNLFLMSCSPEKLNS